MKFKKEDMTHYSLYTTLFANYLLIAWFVTKTCTEMHNDMEAEFLALLRFFNFQNHTNVQHDHS